MTKKSGEVTRRWFLGAGLGAGVMGAGIVGCQQGSGLGRANGAAGKATGVETDKLAIIYPDQDSSEVRWGFLIDMNKCTGCKACAVACKTESDVRLGYFKSGVITQESGAYPNVERNFVPWLCNHCKTPTCLANCPTDPVTGEFTFPGGEVVQYLAKATYQRPDGLVLVDQDRCVGCGGCVTSCPYGARYLDPAKPAGGDPAEYGLTIDEPKAADKCNLCVHRLANGVVPACMNTCAAEARLVGNVNDPSSDISIALESAGSNASALLEGSGTEPQVFYLDLDEAAYAGDEPRKEAGLQMEVPTP